MERPSHINFHSAHPLYRRLVLFGMAASLPAALLWGLTQGMGSYVIKIIDPITFVPEHTQVKPLPPPPDPSLKKVDRIDPIEPPFKFDPGRKDDTGTVSVAPTGDGPVVVTQPAGESRVAMAITATHTIPPYPMLEQRLGVEGKVTLRLTVLADGTVGRAEIVNSSGRSGLDDAARDWILAHWVYKPALENGQPKVSQALATIIFSLTNAR